MFALVFCRHNTKAPSGTFFEVFCLFRKTRELCPIAAAIKYLYPKTSMRGYPKYNILTSMGYTSFLLAYGLRIIIILYYTP